MEGEEGETGDGSIHIGVGECFRREKELMREYRCSDSKTFDPLCASTE